MFEFGKFPRVKEEELSSRRGNISNCSSVPCQVETNSYIRRYPGIIRTSKFILHSVQRATPPPSPKADKPEISYLFTLYQKICTIQGQLNSPLPSFSRWYTSPFQVPRYGTCSWRERAWARQLLMNPLRLTFFLAGWTRLTDALEINIFRGCGCVGLHSESQNFGTVLGDKLSRVDDVVAACFVSFFFFFFFYLVPCLYLRSFRFLFSSSSFPPGGWQRDRS